VEAQTEFDMMSTRELSTKLHVSMNTLAAWRRRGHGPRPYVLGPKTVRYKTAEVDEWLASRLASDTLQGDFRSGLQAGER
jgi:predicted DNA-binding transcriptional regulator AlpA